MNTQIENLRSKLNEDLLANQEIENHLERLTSDLKIIEQVITELREFVKADKLKDEQEEIDFFKNIKPEILALKLEAGLRYNLTINKPINTNEIQITYYDEELKALQSFLRLNTYHYQYYKNGFKNLDALYFLRNAEPLPAPIAETPESDTEFSTPMSYLFAKFMAFEHIQYYILEQMAQLKYPDLNLQSKKTEGISELKWTGDSINLVELAYGLWLTGQLNNGNASLNQIVRWLETNFHVTIGIVQRRFSEIVRRKRLSLTKFIDQMRDSILKKIDSDNG